MTTKNTLLNYQIKRIIGKGGMGTVYLAVHTRINRQVAIKELHPQFSREASIRERFRNEAALLANLHHPNIVALHDYIETGEGVYLIMEYVEGIPLDEYIQKVSGPIPEAKAQEIFAKILDAFAYAHAQGIVHRDIKPSNIMVLPDGDIKILDFGIAKNLQSEERQLTRTGMKIGTIYYMSPEQIRALAVDARTDIYSLGITLFEMLTGSNPFAPDLSEFDVSNKIVNEPLPRARTFYPGISEAMQAVIDRATAKNPTERFQSIEEFKKALLAIQNPANPLNTVEWVVEPPTNGKLTTMDTLDNTGEYRPKKEKEYILLDNQFGLLTNRKVLYIKGKDLFEAGQREEVYLRKIISADLESHREIPTGIFFLLISIPLLIFYFGILTLIFSGFMLGFAGLCFLKFPTVVLVRQDLKKIKMRGWPWHNRAASEYVFTLQQQLKKG
ncbi:MAG: serine/threonine protein kinase [Microscillaceae bacterium]|jgi:serine/threonine protein kinase|nr:serine/threonine protein kinase [Microscillaceae bacterium]